MIGQLASAGHEVVAWNRSAERLQGLPVRDVLTGPEGVLEASVGLIVDHSTIAAEATRTLANDAAERGFVFVAMPVSGGCAGAEAGQLTVFAGGTDADVAAAAQTAEAFAGRISHICPVGARQATKAANQLIVDGLFIFLAGSANLAARKGVDAARMLPAPP